MSKLVVTVELDEKLAKKLIEVKERKGLKKFPEAVRMIISEYYELMQR